MEVTYIGPERPGKLLNDGRLAEPGVPIDVAPEVAASLCATKSWEAASEKTVPTSGTIADVLEAVGGDPEKAIAALQAEHLQNEPRTTLLDQLAKIIDTAPGGEE